MMKLGIRFGLAACVLFASVSSARADLIVTPLGGAVTATSLANSLATAGSGITINSATYTGANIASGTYSGGTGIIGIESGILLTSGSVNNVVGPNNQTGATTSNGVAGDAGLSTLAGQTTFDASILQIAFTPTGSNIQFSYVFGSEEYLEFVNQFNDVFAFYVNGVNYAVVPGTSSPVSINTINTTVNSAFFVNNTTGTRNTQLDGFTTILSFTAPVNPGVQNTLRLAIADSRDTVLDSAVFIQAGSLQVCGGAGQPPCGTAVPEPASIGLLLMGLAGAAARRFNRA
jgi:hypothetical protein